MSTPKLRKAGAPSPLMDGTHDDQGLRAPIPFDVSAAGAPELAGSYAAASAKSEGVSQEAIKAWRALNDASAGPVFAPVDPFDLGKDAPPRLERMMRLIRPLCIGALMAIPTVGAASVGVVSGIDPARGRAIAEASVLFLAGLPTDIVMLIGVLATGYGFAKTIETLKGKRGL